MGLLSKDQILTADDLQTEDVEVPEWGGTVRLRGLTGAERDAYEYAMIQAREKGNLGKVGVRSGFVAKCIVDEQGQRVFSDGDIQKLGMKSSAVLDRLFEKAAKLSRFGDDDVDELAGNLDETDGEPSPSDSLNISTSPEVNSSDVLAPQS